MLSAVVLAVLVTPCVIPLERMDGVIAPCSSRIRGVPCPLCGMTTAFYLISAGEFARARSSNRHAITLYLLLLANEAVLGGWGITKSLRRICRCKH